MSLHVRRRPCDRLAAGQVLAAPAAAIRQVIDDLIRVVDQRQCATRCAGLLARLATSALPPVTHAGEPGPLRSFAPTGASAPRSAQPGRRPEPVTPHSSEPAGPPARAVPSAGRESGAQPLGRCRAWNPRNRCWWANPQPIGGRAVPTGVGGKVRLDLGRTPSIGPDAVAMLVRSVRPGRNRRPNRAPDTSRRKQRMTSTGQTTPSGGETPAVDRHPRPPKPRGPSVRTRRSARRRPGRRPPPRTARPPRSRPDHRPSASAVATPQPLRRELPGPCHGAGAAGSGCRADARRTRAHPGA
jgi:hypothetical protein